MTQTTVKYATDLRKTDISRELLQQVEDILEAVPQVRTEFEDPTVEIAKKHLIIDRIFPQEIRNFIKILCDNQDFQLFDAICEEYVNARLQENTNAVRAELICFV